MQDTKIVYLALILLCYAFMMTGLVTEYRTHTAAERRELQTGPMIFAMTMLCLSLTVFWGRFFQVWG